MTRGTWKKSPAHPTTKTIFNKPQGLAGSVGDRSGRLPYADRGRDGDVGRDSARRAIALSTREETMKTYARHLTARLFGRTRMGGLYLYWAFGK
jgi:hypothetical protein